MLINRLITEVPGFALEIFRRYRDNDASPLASYAGAALGQLVGKPEGRLLISELLKESESAEALRLVAEAYGRQTPSERYIEEDVALLRQIFRSKEPSVLALTGSVSHTVAKVDPPLAVDLICDVDLRLAGRSVHEIFMWLSHENTIPAASIDAGRLKLLVRKLVKLNRLDDYWVLKFLKRVMSIDPDAVSRMFLVRLRVASMCKDWSYRPVEPQYLGDAADAKSGGLGLLEKPGGERRLRHLLDNALRMVGSTHGIFEIGELVAVLCGKFDQPLLEVLVDWMKQGGSDHVKVIAAVLGAAQNTLLYESPTFIRDVISAAEMVGEEAVGTMTSALIGATLSGGRSTTPGEPYNEDVRLRDYSKEMLAGLSRTDPAHEMFSVLLRAAEQGIERQLREKEALDSEDEE
ncbi:hypothetical protein LRS03_12995 [Rhizobacter sp. J219]|uniref:hypothetical protein n=1 Tax=Rhizobacter sp. J219 TaxID=2898430 RepID=UPI0021517A60|nr:hypothetical protein [Rhizobacter sp. J219]MCR5883723.1 hypothetical protein [Rhizobacter sp. J219]